MVFAAIAAVGFGSAAVISHQSAMTVVQLPRIAAVAALIAAPAAAFLALRMEPFFIQNGVDPFIYIGYTENARDLILRFHYPYFAVRFGLLVPTQIASGLLGPLHGYFALRYLLALLATVSVYALARRLGSRWAGWFGVAFVLTSPVFVRALLTTYSVTTAVPFLIAGLALCLGPAPRHAVALRFAAGGAFAMAIHSNPFAAGVMLSLLTPLAVLAVVRRRTRELWSLAWVAAGAAVVTLLGVGYYRIAYGDGDIFTPTAEGARLWGPAGWVTQSADWRWMNYSPHLLIPIVALALGAAAIAAVARDERRTSANGWGTRLLRSPALDPVAALAGCIVLYAGGQFVLGRPVLELHYYAAYLFAPTAVTATAAIAVLTKASATARQSRDERPAMVALITLVALAFLSTAMRPAHAVFAWPGGVLLVLVAAAAAAVAVRRRSILAPAMALVCLPLGLLAWCAPRGMPLAAGHDPLYADALGNPDRRGIEQYQVAASFVQWTPKWLQHPGSMVFWYRGDDQTLNLVQSTFLWRATALMLWGNGLPTLSAREVEMLRTRTPRFLVLLARDRSDLTLGTDAIVAHGIAVRGVSDERIAVGDTAVFLRTLELEPSPCDRQWRTFTNWLDLGPCGTGNGAGERQPESAPAC